jgi:hypothetical protein
VGGPEGSGHMDHTEHGKIRIHNHNMHTYIRKSQGMPRFVFWSDESSSHIVSRHRDASLYTPSGVGFIL